MADEKISQLSDAGPPQGTDQLVLARSGSTLSLLWSSVLSALNLGTAATHAATDFDAAGAAAAAQAASQPLDSDLTALAGLDSSTSGAIASDGSGWIKKTYAQFKTALSLVSSDVGLGNVTNDAQLKIASNLSDLNNTGTARTNLGLVIGTDVEAHDTDLTTIAGLAPTNDDVLQRKAGAWANRSISQLLTDLAAAGTTFQPLDADLTALAGLTSAADKLPYFTGSGTAAVTSLSSFIRTLLDDTDAATARTTLGIPGAELDYVEITSSVTVTSTADGTSGGTAVITGNSVAYDGSTRICIEFFSPGANIVPGAAARILFTNLYDGTTDLGRMSETDGPVSAVVSRSPVYWRRFLTPSNASHTYIVRAWKDSAGDTDSILAGAGGASTIAPAFMRITKA